MAQDANITQIEFALRKVAMLLIDDSDFTPVYERLEAELAKAKAASDGKTDAQRRAAALLAH